MRRPVPTALLIAGMLGAAGGAIAQDGKDSARQPAERPAVRQSAEQAAAAERARAEALREWAEIGPAGVEHAEGRAGPTISLDFAGGDLQEYVESLKAAAEPEPTNVLVRGDARAIEVGPTELRDVSLLTALQLVSGDYQKGDTGFKVMASNVGTSSASGDAFLVAVRSFGPVSGVPRPMETFVLSLRGMTTPLPGDPPEIVVPAETILTAIETATGLLGADEIEMRYHPDSGLLILGGDPRPLEAAGEVFRRMEQDVERRRDRAREIQQAQGLTNPEALEEQLSAARAEVQLAEVRLEAAEHARRAVEARLHELRASQEAGAVDAQTVREAEIAAAEAQVARTEHQIHHEMAAERYQRVERALERARAIAAGGGPETEAQALREENAMLRDRLAAMEAQMAELRARLEAREREPSRERR